jgi:hypothetical protein
MSTFIQVQSSFIVLTHDYVTDYLKKNGIEIQSIQTIKNKIIWEKDNAQQTDSKATNSKPTNSKATNSKATNSKPTNSKLSDSTRNDFIYFILEFLNDTTLEKFKEAIKSTASLKNTVSYDLTKSIINIGDAWNPSRISKRRRMVTTTMQAVATPNGTSGVLPGSNMLSRKLNYGRYGNTQRPLPPLPNTVGDPLQPSA